MFLKSFDGGFLFRLKYALTLFFKSGPLVVAELLARLRYCGLAKFANMLYSLGAFVVKSLDLFVILFRYAFEGQRVFFFRNGDFLLCNGLFAKC